MRYNKIRKMDISNGPGVRVSIFMQGCEFHCKNCFNAETWNFKGGKEFTDETINRVLELSEKDYVAGLSILGGEPMHPKNIDGTIELAREFKKKFPKKTVWVWSGFLYDDIMERNKEVFDYIGLGNKYYDENTPWVAVKEDINKFNDITYTCIYMIANIANMINPFMPTTSEKIKDMLSLKPFAWKEEVISGNIKINDLKLLFERIDE